MADGQLANKVIVIVGGTGGMGLSAAKACLRAGARVMCVGLAETVEGARGELEGVATEAAGGARFCVMAADARDESTAEKAIARAIEELGGFDGLYHVAGGSGRRLGDGAVHEVTDEGWARTIELNLTSVFWSNRAAVRAFLARKMRGSVVNMTSALAESPEPRFFATAAYAAAKAGIIGLTRSCAARYAAEGIRFNAVAPALVETPMSRRATGDEAIAKFLESKQPLAGGAMRAEDVDAAAVFLLSDGARMVTGQVLGVDGGWSVSQGQWT